MDRAVCMPGKPSQNLVWGTCGWWARCTALLGMLGLLCAMQPTVCNVGKCTLLLPPSFLPQQWWFFKMKRAIPSLCCWNASPIYSQQLQKGSWAVKKVLAWSLLSTVSWLTLLALLAMVAIRLTVELILWRDLRTGALPDCPEHFCLGHCVRLSIHTEELPRRSPVSFVLAALICGCTSCCSRRRYFCLTSGRT